MTRKDYRLIAEAIKATREYAKQSSNLRFLTPDQALNYLTGYLTHGLQRDNERFNRVTFAVASGSPRGLRTANDLLNAGLITQNGETDAESDARLSKEVKDYIRRPTL